MKTKNGLVALVLGAASLSSCAIPVKLVDSRPLRVEIINYDSQKPAYVPPTAPPSAPPSVPVQNPVVPVDDKDKGYISKPLPKETK